MSNQFKMKSINKTCYIAALITLLSVMTSCDDEELYKTVVSVEPDVIFNFYDTDGNPSDRGSNSFRIENPILTDENASDRDINFTFISEFILPEGITVDSVTVQYQADFILSNGGSAPFGWIRWETVRPADDRLNGNRLTYSFNVGELNDIYPFPPTLPRLLTNGAVQGIVKDANNARVQIYLSDGRDLISTKVIFWYPVVPGDPE